MTKKEETTREKILRIAGAEFARIGFNGARIDEIAKKAGCNKATLYYHIGGKEALYEAVLLEVFPRLAEEIEERVKRAESIKEKLHAFVLSLVTTLMKHQEISPVMMREIASGGRELPASVLSCMARICSVTTSLIEQAVQEGIFRKTDPLLAHLMIVGGINFYIAGEGMRERVRLQAEDEHVCSENNDACNAEKLAEEVSSIIFQGLQKKV